VSTVTLPWSSSVLQRPPARGPAPSAVIMANGTSSLCTRAMVSTSGTVEVSEVATVVGGHEVIRELDRGHAATQ